MTSPVETPPGTDRTVLRGKILTEAGFLPDAAVAVEGAVLGYVGPAAGLERRPGDTTVEIAADEVLVPGLVDLHCHGGYGVDFSGADIDEARRAIARLHQDGTTTVLASLVTGAPEALLGQAQLLAVLAEEGLIGGIHLEGPFLSEARCGAQNPRWLRAPDLGLARELIKAAGGHLRTMTYAPELPGAEALVSLLAGSGVIPSLGHTAAGPEQAGGSLARARRELAGSAASRGTRPTVTHLFNGMDPLHHRAPGAVSACLRAARGGDAVVELIADNTHLAPQLVATMFELLGAANIALVTDSMAAAGLHDGEYMLGPTEVTVSGGTARVTATGAIAGGTASMLELVRNTAAAGVALPDALSAASLVPARVLGRQDIGRLAPGAAADLLVLDAGLGARAAMRQGEWLPAPDARG